MSSPIAGAWEMVSDSGILGFDSSPIGIGVFTDAYYSVVVTEKNRKRFESDEPTDVEAAEAYRTINASAGPYEISGSTIIFHRVANRNPNLTGMNVHWQFTIDGDRLTTGPLTWRRLG